MGAPGERENKGGLLPPSGPRAQHPLLGVPGLAAGQVAAPGGAAHRKRRGRLPPQQNHRRGLCPPPAKKPGGLLPPCNRERGGLPPSLATHRGPGGPLAARDRRQGAGGAEVRGGSGHPEEKRGRGGVGIWVFFVVVVGLVVMGGGEELGG